MEKVVGHLEGLMDKKGLEEAAEKVTVLSIDRKQFYTPVLGTYPKHAAPALSHTTWNRGELTQFSYVHLIQAPYGYLRLQHDPPPSMMLSCDGDYVYMRLTQTGQQIPSKDPLCSSRGWRIETESTTCKKSPKVDT